LDYSQEHVWSEAFEQLRIAVAQLSLDGTLLTVNEHLCELIGYQKKDLLGRDFRKFLQLGESQSAFETAINRLVAGEMLHYSIDMRTKGTAGKVLWLKLVFSLTRNDITSGPRSLTVVAEDISALKQADQQRDELSRRMVSGQEADRARIARELHDNIGQSLLVFKLQMLRAGKPVSGDATKTHAGLIELSAKLDTIIHTVSHLSHDLHSSTLEYLGLATALKGHCEECSQQLRFPIQFYCDEGEKELDSETALALLRVVQEGIHNAVKHSQAKSILVRLTFSDQGLRLEISDDGVGFDVEAARLAEGLGLISMRERIQLIGGKFDIASSRGKGTRITAQVPISRNVGQILSVV
jgi:PAS domain S-box-containing protein